MNPQENVQKRKSTERNCPESEIQRVMRAMGSGEKKERLHIVRERRTKNAGGRTERGIGSGSRNKADHPDLPV